jgi:tetratricopeptide (TPR) repeat protein
VQRSKLYLTEKRYRDTIQDLTEALKNRPNDPSILYKRGEAMYLNKDFKQALENLQAALNFEPEASYEPDIHYHIGLSYSNLEEFEYSIYPFSRAVDLCPLEAVYYHERAKAYLLTEEYENAVEDFSKVIELQPANPHAYFGRAFAYKNLRVYDKAVGSGSLGRRLRASEGAGSRRSAADRELQEDLQRKVHQTL